LSHTPHEIHFAKSLVARRKLLLFSRSQLTELIIRHPWLWSL